MDTGGTRAGTGDALGEGGAASGAGTLGGVTVSTGGEVAAAKIVARSSSAWSWDWPKVAKGAAGDGCLSALIRDWAERSATSAEEVLGMAQLWGKNWTVLAIRSEAVFVT